MITAPLAYNATQTIRLIWAKDRWGKRFYIDADKWAAGKIGLAAYHPNGTRKSEPGSFGRRDQVYHRENIVEVEKI